jgi:hypothetical protein
MNDRSFTLMQTLNSECFCISLDDAALRRALERELERPELVDLVKERCPYLFAARPVFVSKAHLQRMASVVRAVESVVALPAYREEVLVGAPAIARHEPRGARSVFFGYDFHVDGDRLGLIEINTNRAGAGARHRRHVSQRVAPEQLHRPVAAHRDRRRRSTSACQRRRKSCCWRISRTHEYHWLMKCSATRRSRPAHRKAICPSGRTRY